MKLLAYIANFTMQLLANIYEALFKRNKYKQSKLLINAMLMRIETIKRRQSVMSKYFRSGIAELLRLGHDSDSFERVGRQYVYENMLLSYEFVERYCTLVSNQLNAMTDGFPDGCPDECKEAVSSLMYAATRYGDVPELRELRSLFFDMFGDSLESFVNKEFIDLLNPDSLTNSPTKEMKIQCMQEIAQEHGVEWFGTVDDNQDNEPHVTYPMNDWMVNVQETINDDSKDHEKDESNDDNDDDIEKQIENMRQRILDYMSRTTTQLSTSPDSNASPEECSTYSDDLTESRSSEHDDEKENEDVPNASSYVVKWDDEKVVVAPCVKNRQWRTHAALPHAKMHPVECWLASTMVEEVPKVNESVAKYQVDSTVNPSRGHVHPKLPDYDEIIALFASIRAKSCQETFRPTSLVNSPQLCGQSSNTIVDISVM